MHERIQYIDALKFTAIFAVIAIHGFCICKAEILNFPIRNFQQIFRFAVPLFLMITGTLFLNKQMDLKSFFQKRFIRILYPLIFFSIIVYLMFGVHINVYYWYSFMILGTLFAIPVINKFISYSSENEIRYFIIIFIIFSALQQILNIFDIEYAVDMTFFINPIAYLVIGYYLSHNDFNYSPNKILIISAVIFVFTSLIKMHTGNYNYTHQFHTYLDLSFLEIFQTSAVFLFFRYLYSDKISGIFIFIQKILKNNSIEKVLLSVSKSSYGMYFIQHPLIFNIIYPYFFKKLSLTGTQSLLLICAIIILVFLISWIVTLILSKIPLINKFSGYH